MSILGSFFHARARARADRRAQERHTAIRKLVVRETSRFDEVSPGAYPDNPAHWLASDIILELEKTRGFRDLDPDDLRDVIVTNALRFLPPKDKSSST